MGYDWKGYDWKSSMYIDEADFVTNTTTSLVSCKLCGDTIPWNTVLLYRACYEKNSGYPEQCLNCVNDKDKPTSTVTIMFKGSTALKNASFFANKYFDALRNEIKHIAGYENLEAIKTETVNAYYDSATKVALFITYKFSDALLDLKKQEMMDACNQMIKDRMYAVTWEKL